MELEKKTLLSKVEKGIYEALPKLKEFGIGSLYYYFSEKTIFKVVSATSSRVYCLNLNDGVVWEQQTDIISLEKNSLVENIGKELKLKHFLEYLDAKGIQYDVSIKDLILTIETKYEQKNVSLSWNLKSENLKEQNIETFKKILTLI